ncbi:hypothetical protein HZS_118 [Henneguya salminicola]|nr:hypothetical protein HZS_118 [Henneguya salminicola]
MKRGALLSDSNGENILYVSINDTNVEQTLIPIHDSNNSFTQKFKYIKYPKTGGKIPEIKLITKNIKILLEQKNLLDIILSTPDELAHEDAILLFFKFTEINEAIAGWTHRKQNEIFILKYNLTNISKNFIIFGKTIVKN